MKATGLFSAFSDYYTHQKIKHYTFHAVFFTLRTKKIYIYAKSHAKEDI